MTDDERRVIWNHVLNTRRTMREAIAANDVGQYSFDVREMRNEIEMLLDVLVELEDLDSSASSDAEADE